MGFRPYQKKFKGENEFDVDKVVLEEKDDVIASSTSTAEATETERRGTLTHISLPNAT